MLRFTSHRSLCLAFAVGLTSLLGTHRGTLTQRAAAQTAGAGKSAREKLAAALVEAEDDAARGRLLERGKESLDRELAGALVGPAERLRMRGELAPALENYRRGAELGAAAGNNSVLARALNDAAIIHRKLGHISRAQGEHERALDYYRQSLSLREAAGDKDGISITLNSLALLHRARRPRTGRAAK